MQPNDLFIAFLLGVLLIGFALPVVLEVMAGKKRPLALVSLHILALYGLIIGLCAFLNLFH